MSRTKDRLSLLGYGALRAWLGRRKPPPLAEARNFLLLQHHHRVGHAVVATAALRALRAAVPDARIVVAATPLSFDLFSNSPHIDRLLPMPDPRHGLRPAIAALRHANLFAGAPFVALLTLGNEGAPNQLAVIRAGAHTIVGSVSGEFQPGAFLLASDPSKAIDATRPGFVLFRRDRKLSRVAHDLQLIRALGHAPALAREVQRNPDLLEPEVHPGPAASAVAANLLRDGGIDPGRPFAVLITQTSPDDSRTWPAESFREMARWLHLRRGLQIVFTGTAAESAAIEAIRAPLDIPTVSLAGRTTLPQLAAVLAAAALGVGFDTGTMHLARAVALPLVIIAPPSGAPIDWLPIGHPRARILYSAYRPPACDHPVPGELSTEAVQHEAEALLHLYPPTLGWRTPNPEANRTEDVTPRVP